MQDLQGRLEEVCRIAVQLEKETGCPAQETVAQWAIESQWGAKPAGQHNYFGIKRAARHARFCTVLTREVINGKSVMQNLEFADYDSLADSCADFAWLITHGSPYAVAWRAYQEGKDLDRFLDSIAHVYATDPSYSKLVRTIARQANVSTAIEKAWAV
jgi:flagellum-specific peptidoglycan hydrolase FlgJ